MKPEHLACVGVLVVPRKTRLLLLIRPMPWSPCGNQIAFAASGLIQRDQYPADRKFVAAIEHKRLPAIPAIVVIISDRCSVIIDNISRMKIAVLRLPSGESIRIKVRSMVGLSMPDKWEYPWFAAWDLAFPQNSATTCSKEDSSELTRHDRSEPASLYRREEPSECL